MGRIAGRFKSKILVFKMNTELSRSKEIGMIESGETEKGSIGFYEFIRRAKELFDTGDLDRLENVYKRDVARNLEKARRELFAESGAWPALVEKGLSSNLTFYMHRQRISEWMADSEKDASEALKSIWTEDQLSVGERVRAFCDRLPKDRNLNGVGTRTNIASVFLMGLDEERYPPFRIRVFKKACVHTGYKLPENDMDEAALYEHFLGFLNYFGEELGKHDVQLDHLLDAQGMVWQLKNELPRLGIQPVKPKSLNLLADELLLSQDFLEKICALLDDKQQVIFQGPPGTGKTYVARELAKHLSEPAGRVTLVQFHPSYAYEDFVRGFRPKIMESGQSGFSLQDGPLLRAAKMAREEPGAKHYLLIDEINRGNLAKVFGELYFLLEYRDERIHMQYQEENEDDFSLPENLYIIGTMNTADRSIALVDLALRRRFYFVEFHPDEDPVRSVLRKWLKQNKLENMVWVTGVVDQANELLKDDRHAAIGPSYFMKEDLEEEDVRRIWKHSVIPYIEERLFGIDVSLDAFDMDNLKEQAIQALEQKESQEQADENEGSNSPE